MSRLAINIILLVHFAAVGAASQDKPDPKGEDPIAARLNEAKQKYQAVVEKARKKVLDTFDQADKSVIEDKTLNPAEKLDRLDLLATGRKAFESGATLPKLEKSLKQAVDDYQRESKAAQGVCEKAFDEAANDYLKSDRPSAKAVIDSKPGYFKAAGLTAAATGAPTSVAPSAQNTSGPKKDDPIAAELKAAQKNFQTAVEQARKKVFDALANADRSVVEDKALKPEEKVKRLDLLDADRKAFESRGTLPKSASLKQAVEDYQKELRPALAAIENAFDEAADKYLRNDRTAARAVLAAKPGFFKGFGIVPPAPAMPKKTELEWKSLFNGKDLAGWNTNAEWKDGWRVEKATLFWSRSGASFLWTERNDYADFHLKVKTRIGDGGYSQIIVRDNYNTTGDRHVGYVVVINSNNENQQKTGTFAGGGRGVITLVTRSPVAAGTWFPLEVIAKGNHIVVKVDGLTTADYTEADKEKVIRSGRITLFPVSKKIGTLEFQKIEVKEYP